HHAAVSREGPARLSRGHVPQSNVAVLAAGRQRPAVGSAGETGDSAAVSLERPHQPRPAHLAPGSHYSEEKECDYGEKQEVERHCMILGLHGFVSSGASLNARSVGAWHRLNSRWPAGATCG